MLRQHSVLFEQIRRYRREETKTLARKYGHKVGWTAQPVWRYFGFPNEKQTRRPMHYFLLAVVRIFRAAVVIAKMCKRM